MLDLHRHDHFSLFDGFGKAKDNAKHAKKLGYTALGLANHGNTSGLVQHYFACKNEEIKPILGVEAYFQPVWNKEKPRYHLCIFVKNKLGYLNLNKLMTLADSQMYYKPIVTFKDLQKHHDGLIVTSACIAGPIANLISKGKDELAKKAAIKLKEIFGDDFYIEIQPYKLSIENMQEEVNVKLYHLARELKIKCILTSDSHYANKEDWPTYLKMHEISSPEFDAEVTYGQRYMPTEKELVDRFLDMHGLTSYHIFETDKFAKECINNLKEIENKVDEEVLSELELKLPEFIEGHHSSYDLLLEKVKEGLKIRGKNNKKYIQRCKQELEIIKGHEFSDYFLIVADYVNWAKSNGISVGPGRGSVCNSQVAWALGITDVDSLYFGLDFRRFLRSDKKKMPDIDLDFETSRRYEVIDYIINKYKGHAAQIRSYGLYQVDNLVNDLAKVCGIEEASEIKSLKNLIRDNMDENELDAIKLKKSKRYSYFNSTYDNVLIHFEKLYGHVKYLGTHAAGVAITGGILEQYTPLKFDRKTNKKFTSFDLADLESINIIKFDILGLSTMEQIGILRKLTKKEMDESWFTDKKLFDQFKSGNTDGIFQFEKATAKQILQDINADCFEDVIAASSMNRPGPLKLGMPAMYAENKQNNDKINKDTPYWDYTKDTFGTIIYQEQILQICVNIGGFEWSEADKVLKMERGATGTALRIYNENYEVLSKKFIKNAVKHGLTKQEAIDLFEALMVYSFNKGHSTGYSIISLQEMYYKTYYPTEFWFIKCKYAPNENDLFKYKANASASGVLIFIPHVNYSAEYTLRTIEGETIIQEGLSSIKFVGEKAATFIEKERKKNGNYKNLDDFLERCQVKGSGINKRVVEQLIDNGALEFNKKVYLNRVTKYNSTLYMKGVRTQNE